MSDDPLTRAPEIQFYIPATASLLERRPRTLKHGDTFAVFDHYGDIIAGKGSPEGLYHNDTRYLSALQILINGRRPLLLSSTVQDNNAVLRVDLTNPDRVEHGRLGLPRDTIHMLRSKFLWCGTCYERLGLRSYHNREQRIELSIRVAADFADIFEVRGQHRPRRGETTLELSSDRIQWRHRGLDGVERVSLIAFDVAPQVLSAGAATYQIDIEAGGRASLFYSVSCIEGGSTPRPMPRSYFPCMRRARHDLHAATARAATVETSNDIFNEVLCRSMADLYMLVTDTKHGSYPYAGIPWFCTAFGRDALITALEVLWVDATIARGVLRFLAATQATEHSARTDAAPGKILHESRRGEMAALGEVPFAQYYGAVDGTPLFIVLAGRYLERTGDLETVAALWPHIEAALRWMDTDGDPDGDGFIEYQRMVPGGLVNQGWKDSSDSIFHADGTDAEGAIALAEVQGYAYAARPEAARIAAAIGFSARARTLTQQGEQLKARFEATFWCDDIGMYALALDGDKRPCAVRSSNAGQVLFSGIASPERARRVADQLVHRDFYSGWGVRTLASTEPRYNPMSYHNGSIWPHDNAIIGLGLARYGLGRHLEQIFTGIFDAATYMDLRRLPELYCGFQRASRTAPTFYPVACSPQAWSSAAPFALLHACLGLEIDHAREELRLRRPRLPAFIDEAHVRSLTVAGGRVDLTLRRLGEGVTTEVRRNEAGVRIHVIL